MAGGWPNSMGADDLDQLLDSVSGDAMSSDPNDLPVGFAGLTPTAIASGQQLVTAPLSAWLRPDRLVLGGAACVDLSYVYDIRVGTISLNVGSQPIPCVAWARDAIGTRLRAAVWASPSVPPQVGFQNSTGGSITYAGGIFGPASRTDPANKK